MTVDEVTQGAPRVRPPSAPPSKMTSILPAAAVVLVAVGTLALFAVVDVLTSGRTTPTTVPQIVGTLELGHTSLFAHAVQDETPPQDVASGLVVPAGTRLVAELTTGGGGPGNYDLKLRLRVDAPRARLLGFYRSELGALGWALYSVSGGSTAESAELLFQKAGSDQNYWELGVDATATSPRVTTFTFRLFEQTDF